ncbi:MAG: DUF2304 domain-containing protein [Candidatus Eisenbacteria bacterium]|nr:DUF2304 domain-containing protein [Candidatus Eisenbacteria bacterium]
MIIERYKELALLVCLGLVLVILELVRRKRLGVRYSLVWLGVTVGMAVMALWDGMLDLVRRSIGATQLSSTLFFLGIIFSLVILLHFSIKISEFSQQIRMLAKEIGLLKARGGPGSPPDPPEPGA